MDPKLQATARLRVILMFWQDNQFSILFVFGHCERGIYISMDSIFYFLAPNYSLPLPYWYVVQKLDELHSSHFASAFKPISIWGIQAKRTLLIPASCGLKSIHLLHASLDSLLNILYLPNHLWILFLVTPVLNLFLAPINTTYLTCWVL